MARKKYELTQAEWEIITAVWEQEPCAAPTITEALEKKKGWSYSTVKTLMDRMVKKNLLKPERIRNLILYRSVITRPQAQRSEIMRTVRCAFDGALTPMMQFLLDSGELSGGQIDELEKMIKDKKVKREAL
jgi:BlaI family penicillinase repressor